MNNKPIPGISATIPEQVAPIEAGTVPFNAMIDPAQADVARINEQLAQMPAAVPSAQDLQQIQKSLPQVSVPTPASVTPPIPSPARAVDWLLTPTSGQLPPEQTQEIEIPQVTAETLAGVGAPVPPSAPSQRDVDSVVNTMNGNARAANAANIAAAEAEKEALDMERINNERMAETQRRINELDNQVRTKSLPEIMSSGTFGQKIGAAIALGLGAVSQGLSGAKENPVLDFMNKLADQQAAKDKLTQEQKDSLRKMLYEQGQLQIQRMEAATNNRYRKEMLGLERDKLTQEKIAIEQAQKAAATAQQQATDMWSGRPITDAEYASLKSEDKDRIVNLIDGRRVLVNSSANARDWGTKSQEVYNALDAVKKLKEMAAGGWTLQKYFSAKPLIQKLVGGLRLPYTGPGVLTDTERAQLISSIGNPMNILSFKSLELAKLGQVEEDLNANLQNTAKINGIRTKLTPDTFYLTRTRDGEEVARTEDYLVRALKASNPKATTESVLNFIRNPKNYRRLDQ